MAFNIEDHYLPMKKLTKHVNILLLIFDPTLLMLFLFT